MQFIKKPGHCGLVLNHTAPASETLKDMQPAGPNPKLCLLNPICSEWSLLAAFNVAISMITQTLMSENKHKPAEPRSNLTRWFEHACPGGGAGAFSSGAPPASASAISFPASPASPVSPVPPSVPAVPPVPPAPPSVPPGAFASGLASVTSVALSASFAVMSTPAKGVSSLYPAHKL